MAIDRRFLNWGVFFVCLGAVPLLVRQGLVSESTAGDAWRLWPLIIVGIGVAILLRRTPAAFAGGLVVAATFGLAFGGLLAAGPQLVSMTGCGNPQGSGTTVTSQGNGTFGATGTARIQMDCGVLTVATQSGNAWTFRADDPPDGAAILDHSDTSFDLSAPTGSTAFWNPAGSHNRNWNVTLPRGSAVDLTVGVNAGSGAIDLSGANLTRFDASVNAGDLKVDLRSATATDISVSVNAGSARVQLPSSSSSSGTLTVNAGSLDLCVPSGTGLRIAVRGALASTDFSPAGLSHSGDTWTSPDFAGAANRIDLQLEANLASVNLNPSGGCQ